MTIGIITLHSNTNFGGGLQQIALFETLKALGHDPKFLCVQNDVTESTARHLLGIVSSYSIRQLFDAVHEAFRRIADKREPETPNWTLYKKTDEFNYTRLNYTPKFGLAELPVYVAACDALVFGSDQVWTDVYSPVLPYFGDGMHGFGGKKIAYAACSVHRRVPIYNRRKIRTLLSDFDAVSVRDETSRELVRNYSALNPQLVCDPTLLYDFKAYLKHSPIEGDYIFAYVLGDKTSDWHQRNIDKIKAETGISKVVVLTTSLDEKYPWADIVITDALAIDWMNILQGASFVYTNSFHAVIFSLKFHRQFIAYYGDIARSSRMIGLRSQFGLDGRIVKEPIAVDLNNQIEFAATDSIIADLAIDSMAFLKSALDNTQINYGI